MGSPTELNSLPLNRASSRTNLTAQHMITHLMPQIDEGYNYYPNSHQLSVISYQKKVEDRDVLTKN